MRNLTSGLGCAAVTMMAVLAPAWVLRCHEPSAPENTRPRVLRSRGVTLEAWVRLRSYRACPVIAAAGAYRLGLACLPGGGGAGWLVFAGPFAGKAYISEELVPLARWSHVAGVHDGRAGEVLIDGRIVTAGRMVSDGAAVPLGHDPWQGSAVISRPVGRDRPVPRGPHASLDGDRAGSRMVRRWRSAARIAATRGLPGRFAPIDDAAEAAGAGPGSFSPSRPAPAWHITPTGWLILAAGSLLSAAIVGAGLHLLRPGPLARRRIHPR